MVPDGTSVSPIVQNGTKGWESLSHQILGIIRDGEIRCLGIPARYLFLLCQWDEPTISLPAPLVRGSAADPTSRSVPMAMNASFPTRCLSGYFTPWSPISATEECHAHCSDREVWEVPGLSPLLGYPALGTLLCCLFSSSFCFGFVFLLSRQWTLLFPVS